MKNNTYLILAIMFAIFGLGVFGLVLWPDASLAARIGFFTTGFGSGVCTAFYVAGRRLQAE